MFLLNKDSSQVCIIIIALHYYYFYDVCRKQLCAVVQALCAVSGEKGRNMLDRLDVRYLGVAASRLATKSPRQSPAKSARMMSSSTVRLTTPPQQTVNRLRTLNPVVLPRNKVRMTNPPDQLSYFYPFSLTLYTK